MPQVRTIQATKGLLAEKLPVAAYCRVSSDSEDQRNSFVAQVKEYTARIESNAQWTLAGIYADKGITGTSAKKRPEFLRLIEDCRSGKVKRILTKSISRFARNTMECLEYVRELKMLGVSVYFEKENMDTAELSGELLVSIFGSIAQEESASISSNMRWSYERRMKAGEFNTCFAPFGYRIQNGALVIQEDEADIIRWIFQSYVDGMSQSEIARILTEKEVATRGKRFVWTKCLIRYILHNERYMGDALVQKRYTVPGPISYEKRNKGEVPQYYIEDANPAIIPADIFRQAQHLCTKRTVVETQNPKNIVLNRICFCAECGASMKRRKNRGGRLFWTCSMHDEAKEKCPTPPMAEAAIETAFLQMYAILKANLDEILQPMANQLRQLQERSVVGNEDVNTLNAEILRLTDQIHAAAKLHNMKFLDTESYLEKSNMLNTQLADVQKKRQQLIQGICKDDHDMLDKTEQLIRSIQDVPEHPASLEDGGIFHAIVDKVLVDKNKKIVFRLINGLELTGWEGIADGQK